MLSQAQVPVYRPFHEKAAADWWISKATCKVVHVLPSAEGTRRPDIPGRRKDDIEQRVGVRDGVLATTIMQVVVGRAQREEPVAGVYYPVDEGLDFGQGLVVGLGYEPTVAKVPTKEVQPAGGQFAGQFPLKGTDADAEVSAEGVYFTSHNADSSDGLFAGGAGNFRTADIHGHFRTFEERAGVERDFEVTVGSGQLIAKGSFQSSNVMLPQWLYWICPRPMQGIFIFRIG